MLKLQSPPLQTRALKSTIRVNLKCAGSGVFNFGLGGGRPKFRGSSEGTLFRKHRNQKGVAKKAEQTQTQQNTQHQHLQLTPIAQEKRSDRFVSLHSPCAHHPSTRRPRRYDIYSLYGGPWGPAFHSIAAVAARMQVATWILRGARGGRLSLSGVWGWWARALGSLRPPQPTTRARGPTMYFCWRAWRRETWGRTQAQPARRPSRSPPIQFHQQARETNETAMKPF